VAEREYGVTRLLDPEGKNAATFVQFVNECLKYEFIVLVNFKCHFKKGLCMEDFIQALPFTVYTLPYLCVVMRILVRIFFPLRFSLIR
jgi:hypothetical protein